jgi:hypothetical protein
LTKWNETFHSPVDVANSLSPPPIPGKALAVGIPGAGKTPALKFAYDTSKAERIFGLKYKPMEEVARDMLLDFGHRGW